MISKRIAGLALATLTAAGGSVAASGVAAHAAGEAQGQVISKTKLITRDAPTTASVAAGSFKPGSVIRLDCKVESQNIDGNRRWYKIDPKAYDGYEWVSARYVRNVGAAPRSCGATTAFHGTSTAQLTVRTGPSTRTAKGEPANRKKGAALTITCKLENQVINGNKFWYQLADGGWASARYVANKGKAPAWC